MFIYHTVICLFFVILFWSVESDHVVINWNISTSSGNSEMEREYKYPMYHDIAPVPCDLTDSCDVFCPGDSDCDEVQKQSFPVTEPRNDCGGPLSVFDCACDKFEKPEWFSLFCYVHKNPIYLGKFYETPRKVEKFGSLKNLIARKRSFNNQQSNLQTKTNMDTQYGSPIMTFIPMSESFPSMSPLMTKLPLKEFSYTCQTKPVSFGFNSSTVCLTRVNRELCQNGHTLSMLPYLVQGGNHSLKSSIPIVLKDLNALKGIQTEIDVKCVTLKSKLFKLNKMDVSYYQEYNTEPCKDLTSSFKTVMQNNTCENVVVFVWYEFTLNGSDIIKLKVDYGLTDVPIDDNDKFSDSISKYIYLKQKFSVTYFDVLVRSNNKRNFSKEDELLNRGYFVGEELNFGQKYTDNSSTSWMRGTLGVFKNGNACDNFSPIMFGFDYFSVCHIRKKFSNCFQLRVEVEEKLENLVRGDNLAAYSNLRPPYNYTVPLLRNYSNDSAESFSNKTGCFVPVVQDVRVQYTSVLTEGGKLVHRVLGVRVDRSYKNRSLDVDIALTSRVFFSYVSSAKDTQRSRFWRRMLSQELSENAWLYIFNAFEDITPSEREEITFWSILLTLLCFSVVACLKFDVNFDWEMRGLGGCCGSKANFGGFRTDSRPPRDRE